MRNKFCYWGYFSAILSFNCNKTYTQQGKKKWDSMHSEHTGNQWLDKSFRLIKIIDLICSIVVLKTNFYVIIG